jgi:tRNA-splicing ligase RtcB
MPFERAARNGGVPIRYFLTPDLMPDQATTDQLEQLANTPGLDHYVAVLPDVHRKPRNVSPTGTVAVARNAIIPRAVDRGVSCGMRTVLSPIDARDMTGPVLDRLFGELMQTVPVEGHGEVLTEEETAEALLRGATWCQKIYGLSDDELDCIEDRGTIPMDGDDPEAILAAIPKKAFKKAQRRFSTLGAGNHFIEAQEIVEILDQETAGTLGLTRGKVLFMFHSDGRSVGGSVMTVYIELCESKFANGRYSSNGSSLWSMPADCEEARDLARAVSAAMNFGFVNRITITEKLRKAVRRVFNDESLELPLLYDCAHVSIKREEWNGEQLWVHRHGASRALPPSRLAGHPKFSKTGQPVAIPGSMGTDSFIVVAREGAAEAFFSVNHGAGRLLDKPQAQARFTEDQVESEMRSKNIRLYRAHCDNIAEQAPGAFKDILQVIQATSASPLVRPVVRLRPMAVLKG